MGIDKKTAAEIEKIKRKQQKNLIANIEKIKAVLGWSNYELFKNTDLKKSNYYRLHNNGDYESKKNATSSESENEETKIYLPSRYIIDTLAEPLGLAPTRLINHIYTNNELLYHSKIITSALSKPTNEEEKLAKLIGEACKYLNFDSNIAAVIKVFNTENLSVEFLSTENFTNKIIHFKNDHWKIDDAQENIRSSIKGISSFVLFNKQYYFYEDEFEELYKELYINPWKEIKAKINGEEKTHPSEKIEIKDETVINENITKAMINNYSIDAIDKYYEYYYESFKQKYALILILAYLLDRNDKIINKKEKERDRDNINAFIYENIIVRIRTNKEQPTNEDDDLYRTIQTLELYNFIENVNSYIKESQKIFDARAEKQDFIYPEEDYEDEE